MKLDLSKLCELEKKYGQDSISFDALRMMVSTILNNENISTELYNISVETLKALRVIIEDDKCCCQCEDTEKKKVQQLNS